MKIINLYGGPSSGKSTTAAGLFYKMKLAHQKVELVTEYAKDLVYDNRLVDMIDQQEYIFAKQNHRQHRLRDKVDWVITDSPILLSAVYPITNQEHVKDLNEWPALSAFTDFVIQSYNTYDNINIYLRRNPELFQQYGREHTLEQSETVDKAILTTLKQTCTQIEYFNTHELVVDEIVEWLAVEY